MPTLRYTPASMIYHPYVHLELYIIIGTVYHHLELYVIIIGGHHGASLAKLYTTSTVSTVYCIGGMLLLYSLLVYYWAMSLDAAIELLMVITKPDPTWSLHITIVCLSPSTALWTLSLHLLYTLLLLYTVCSYHYYLLLHTVCHHLRVYI